MDNTRQGEYRVPDDATRPSTIIARGFPTGPGVTLLDQIAWLNAHGLGIMPGSGFEECDGATIAVAYVAEKTHEE